MADAAVELPKNFFVDVIRSSAIGTFAIRKRQGAHIITISIGKKSLNNLYTLISRLISCYCLVIGLLCKTANGNKLYIQLLKSRSSSVELFARLILVDQSFYA